MYVGLKGKKVAVYVVECEDGEVEAGVKTPAGKRLRSTFHGPLAMKRALAWAEYLLETVRKYSETDETKKEF